jgi:D-aspartate ligase
MPTPQLRYVGTSKKATAVAHTGGEEVGAVVVGGDFLGLGIVRSLGRHGVPICVIDDEHSISRFSRFTKHSVRVPSLRKDQQIIKAVLETGARLGLRNWVLYPTREEIVAAFARHRAALIDYYRVPTPHWTTVQWACDKRNTYSLAQKLSIPTPQTWYPRSPEELHELEDHLPLVIKPAIKEHFIYATRVKAWRVDTAEQLTNRFEEACRLLPPGEVMIQQLIPGDGRQQFSFCAFFKNGDLLGSMTVQRRRQHPPEFGRASTFVETVDLPVLESISMRFLRAIDYYGLVELEYKRDQRDGEYKLLDVNARTWGYHTLGYRAGVDFPYLLFADQIGRTLPVRKAEAGLRWIRLITDFPTGLIEVLHGQVGWREYLASLCKVNTESVFSREDPFPGFAELALLPYLIFKRGF